jgi:hypothetical protein
MTFHKSAIKVLGRSVRASHTLVHKFGPVVGAVSHGVGQAAAFGAMGAGTVGLKKTALGLGLVSVGANKIGDYADRAVRIDRALSEKKR